jgi:hypothetical protein
MVIRLLYAWGGESNDKEIKTPEVVFSFYFVFFFRFVMCVLLRVRKQEAKEAKNHDI